MAVHDLYDPYCCNNQINLVPLQLAVHIQAYAIKEKPAKQ